jgi:hypothetical protein
MSTAQLATDPDPKTRHASIDIPFSLRGASPGTNQPLVMGVPFPAGLANSAMRWGIVRPAEDFSEVQSHVSMRWPDGSIQWLQVAFDSSQLALDNSLGRKSMGILRGLFLGGQLPKKKIAGVRIEPSGSSLEIETGKRSFRLSLGQSIMDSVSSGSATWLGKSGCRIVCHDAQGRLQHWNAESLDIQESGPLKATILMSGSLGRAGLRMLFRLSFFADSACVRIEASIQNPRRAKHRNGFWDLGDPGSFLIKDLSFVVDSEPSLCQQISWRLKPDMPTSTVPKNRFCIYQDSSGGENWKSKNHVNRNGNVQTRLKGFRVRSGKQCSQGLRASPIVAMVGNEGYITCALEEFWQNFPSSIEIEDGQLSVGFWPQEFDDLYELQGGEHNTRVLWLDFGMGNEDACERLAWVDDPAVAVVDPAWIASSRVIAFFPRPGTPLRPEPESILSSAIDGKESFFAKREAIDEYGWRNFGDTWADHEQAFATDPKPIISHYNNQYDLLYGMLIQFLRTGDIRWWRLADPLARHVMDIDIYHTQEDKSAYSGGLFWHTAHYHDAATSSHRSYSAHMRGKSIPAPGGGPANEHDYTSGLLLYYQLTGNPKARETVIGLADWVLAMDDGRQHLLGLVSDISTGLATCTRELGFQGPGRGAGNSIRTLMNAWMISKDTRYLNQAGQWICRTIHPTENISRHNLLNAELNWSYTVYLQTLIFYLEFTRNVIQCQHVRSYAKESLLRYALWMVENERLYLENAGALEYPTETWAAQDLRKGVVLRMAAALSDDTETSAALNAMGTTILDGAWQSLLSFASHRCTRPVAIVLQQCYLEQFFASSADQCEWQEEPSDGLKEFGRPSDFVPQKIVVQSQLRSPFEVTRMLGKSFCAHRWLSLLQRTWPAARIRMFWRFHQ